MAEVTKLCRQAPAQTSLSSYWLHSGFQSSASIRVDSAWVTGWV